MSELKLLPCPFCGGEAKRFKEYGDERNGYADFVGYRCVNCYVSKGARGDTSKPGYADNSKIEERAIKNWNRRTQPEATKPAQDLSAAILALPRKVPEAFRGQENAYLAGARDMRKAAAALASPADALVAGDSETARLEFVFANGLPMKRGGEYRCHGYPGEWFKTEREAIDAAIQAQKDGQE